MKISFSLNLSTGRKIAMAAAMSAVWCLFAFIVFFLPSKNAIEAERKAIYESKVEMEKRYQMTLDMKQLNQKMKKVESELAILENAFMSRDREIEFITDLENLAEKNNVEQTISLGQRQQEQKSTIGRMPVTIESHGRFESLMSYLGDLERLNYYLTVREFEIAIGENRSFGSGTDNDLRITINALSYWRD